MTIALCTGVFLNGCATTHTVSRTDQSVPASATPRILLMSPDIVYQWLTVNGLGEPIPDLTHDAQANFIDALRSYAGVRGVDLAEVDESSGRPPEVDKYVRLHNAIGLTLVTSHVGRKRLPSKMLSETESRFDWSLGPGVAAIAGEREADYLLFIFYRDYQATAGYIGLSLASAALGGPLYWWSYEGGFATLVDAHTGDVVWFKNVNVGVGAGELRFSGTQTVEALFSGIDANWIPQ